MAQQSQQQHLLEFSSPVKEHYAALSSLDGLFKVAMSCIANTDSIIQLADYQTYPLLWLMVKQESTASFPYRQVQASASNSLRIFHHLA